MKKRIILFQIVFCILSGTAFSYSSFKDVFQLKEMITLSPSIFLGSIHDCAVDREKNIWIADSRKFDIKKIDKYGNFLFSLGRKGQGPGEFLFPSGICIKGDEIYVVDPRRRDLQVFQKDGKYRYSFKIQDGRFIKLSSKGYIVISAPLIEGERKSSCIHLYDNKGKKLKSFLPISDFALKNHLISDGVFFDIDSHDNIYTIQEMDYTIYKFTHEGNFLKFFSKRNFYYTPPPDKPFKEFYSRAALTKWIESWVHIVDIKIVNKFLIVNLYKPNPEQYILDIYDLEGNFIVGGLNPDGRLVCSDDDKLYFLKEEEKGSETIYKLLKFSIKVDRLKSFK
ncbi:MAG: 6-bladed beta-propeller [Acidobacteriota bacterium]